MDNMLDFLVEMKSKEFKRSVTIKSQDKETAKQWAEKQLAVLKITNKVRITVTPVLINTGGAKVSTG